jgi:hypothetical protein
MKQWLARTLRIALPLALAVVCGAAQGQTADGVESLERRLAREPARDPGSQAYASGDYTNAHRLWRAAARRGDPVAQYNLGLMYAFGLGVDKDPQAAASWYRSSAEQGYDKAQAVLGLFYATGVGVPRDTSEAVRWWKLAAAQGNADARFNLGMSYWSGDGVPQDFDAASEQFRKSVPAGSAWGRAALGTRAQGGGGDPKTRPPAAGAQPAPAPDGPAAASFRQTLDAAEAGDPVAQAQLGYLYAVGLGVPRSLTEAYLWNNLAAARLPPGPVRDAAVQNRNAAAASISADDMLRAQERARAWMAVFGARR